MGVPARTWTRRQAASLAATAVGGAALAGCGTAAARRPAVAQPKIVLVAELSWQGSVNYVPTVKQLTEDFIAREWSSQHPGVEVRTLGWRGDGNFLNGDAAIAAILSGTGPDILMTCCGTVPIYIDRGILRPLDDHIKQDNVQVDALFPASVMQSMRTPEATYGFPDYGSTQPLFYSQSMLDDLGQPYPSPDWTHEQAANLWRALARQTKGKWVYGANLPVEADGSGDWLIHAWGGHVRDTTWTKSLLDGPEAMAAYTWLADLTTAKAVFPGLWGLGNTPDVVYAGKAAFSPACCGTLEAAATTLGAKVKWDLIPMPKFPSGSSNNFIGNGMYSINAASPHDPDLVWDLFRFITTTSQWQLFFNAQLALQPPILLQDQVWSDWKEIVTRVAPPLQGKNLDTYRQALPGASDWAYFKFAPAQADAIWVKYEHQILSGKMSPELGLRQATQEIDALETVTAQTRVLAAAQAKAFPTQGPAIAPVPPGI